MNRHKPALPVIALLVLGMILINPTAVASVTDTEVYVPDELETFDPPAVGNSYTDSIFGSTVTRLTDARNTADATDPEDVLNLISQESSAVSPFNADNSRLLLQHFSYFGLYDGLGNYLEDLPFEITAATEPRWSTSDPAIFYYIKGNQLKQYNVLSRTATVVCEFTEYTSISGKGGPYLSYDGDHVLLIGDNVEVFVYTLSTGEKDPGLVLPAPGDLNSMLITPDNNIVISWDETGDERHNGVELFDSELNFLHQLATVGGHMGVSRDGNGDEILIWNNAGEQQPDPDCSNAVVSIHLADNTRNCLLPLDWGLSVDLSVPRDTGVFYVSTRGASPDPDWRVYQNEILRVDIEGQTVERLLHHRSKPSDGFYDRARVSVSRDGSRLVYSSNYGLQQQLGYPASYTDVYFVCNITVCESPLHEPDPIPDPEPPGPPILIPGDLETFLPPAAGGSYTDPVFGTQITRLTDARNTVNSAADDGSPLEFISHEYSTMSVFNLDNSRMLLQHFSYFALYDGLGNYLTDLPFDISASSEPRWSEDDPRILYYLNGNQIRSYNIQSQTNTLVREFTEYSNVTSRGEADLSFDGDHLVLFGDNAEVFVYKISNDSKGPVLVLPNPGDANSLYLTPDNNVLVTWDDNGSARYNGIELYDRQMNFLRQITKAGGHMDVARDSNGDEILLWTNAGEVNSDPNCVNGVVKIRLADASRTCLLSLGWGMGLHISAAQNSDGFYVSTHGASPDPQWRAYQNELLYLSKDGQQVERLLHHRSMPSDGYYDQPKVSVSRDGSRFVYASNFGLQQHNNYPVNYTDVYFVCTVAVCESPDLPEPPPEDSDDSDSGEGDDSGSGEGDDSSSGDGGENDDPPQPPPTDSGGNDNPPPPPPVDTGTPDSGGPAIETPEPVTLVDRAYTNKVDNLISSEIDLTSYFPARAGQFYFDLLYGNWVRRLTDARNTPDQALGGERVLPLVGHEYSTISPFNSDNTLLLLQHFSYFALYDGMGNYLEDLPFEINASSEPRWSRTDPSVFFYLNGNELKRFNTQSGLMETVREFPEYRRLSSLGEADISFDGDHLVLVGDNSEIFVYRLSTDRKGRVLAINAGNVDSVYLTPDNNVLVSWVASGSGRYQGIELYDQNLRYRRQITQAGGHMDVARDADGEEILLWTNAGEPITNPACQNAVIKIRLRDRQSTCLIEFDWSLGLHISAPEQHQGWFIISTYLKDSDPLENPDAAIRHRNEILRVNLDGSGLEGLALHWSQNNGAYYYQPRAAVSVDGQRLVFDSNLNFQQLFDYPEDYTDAYLMCLTFCDGFPQQPLQEEGWLTASDYNVEIYRHQENAPGIVYEGDWDQLYSTVFSGGAAMLAESNASMSFEFYGSAVSWFGYSGPWGGKARVLLDDEHETVIDTHADIHQVHTRLLIVTGLEEKLHTLRIEVMASPGADDEQSDTEESGKKWVWIDGFDTYPCPPQTQCGQ